MEKVKVKVKAELLNWDTSKGSPFHSEKGYTDAIGKKAEWEIIDPLRNEKKTKKKVIFKIESELNLELLSTLDLKHCPLISGISKNCEIINLNDDYVKSDKEIITWLDYPFNKTVKATIYPYVRTFKKSGTFTHLNYFGYLAWQVAQIYADIYKNNWEEVGVWGHSFNDLFLEGMVFYPDNEIKLLIGS